MSTIKLVLKKGFIDFHHHWFVDFVKQEDTTV